MMRADEFSCPVDAAISMVGGKYKVVILYHLIDGTHRFSELQKMVPRATPKMLTQQLRELEACNLITRTVYPVVPPRTEYALTDFGRTLIPVLETICEWGRSYVYQHAADETEDVSEA